MDDVLPATIDQFEVVFAGGGEDVGAASGALGGFDELRDEEALTFEAGEEGVNSAFGEDEAGDGSDTFDDLVAVHGLVGEEVEDAEFEYATFDLGEPVGVVVGVEVGGCLLHKLPCTAR